MEREETNIDTLPPVPSIIDTSVEDKRKEKKEEKGGVEYARARAHTRENFSFSDQQDFSHSEENGKDAADLNVLAGQRAENHPTGKISVAREGVEKTFQQDSPWALRTFLQSGGSPTHQFLVGPFHGGAPPNHCPQSGVRRLLETGPRRGRTPETVCHV